MGDSTERMRRLRERQAAALEPAAGPRLRDADELLGPAVEQALAALDLGARYAAAAQLARRYAAAIDEAASPAAALVRLGPLLVKVLAELGATPAARKAAPGPPERRGTGKIDQLRTAHAEAMRKRSGLAAGCPPEVFLLRARCSRADRRSSCDPAVHRRFSCQVVVRWR